MSMCISSILSWLRIAGDILFCRLYVLLYQPIVDEYPKEANGKVVIVTGCTAGIGLQMARRLALAGSKVIMACRGTDRAAKLAEQWAAQGPVSIQIEKLDLCDLSSISAFVAKVEESNDHVDVLINNAGIFHMALSERQMTADGYEEHFQVNFLAPTKLTYMLLPLLRRAQRPRVINVSSSIHGTGAADWDNRNLDTAYSSRAAYANSKLFQVMMTRECQNQLQDSVPIKFFAAHPGNVITDVTRTLPPFIIWLHSMLTFLFLSASEGADSIIHLAVSPHVESKAGGSYHVAGVEATTHPLVKSKLSRELLWRQTCREAGLPLKWT